MAYLAIISTILHSSITILYSSSAVLVNMHMTTLHSVQIRRGTEDRTCDLPCSFDDRNILVTDNKLYCRRTVYVKHGFIRSRPTTHISEDCQHMWIDESFDMHTLYNTCTHSLSNALGFFPTRTLLHYDYHFQPMTCKSSCLASLNLRHVGAVPASQSAIFPIFSE